MRYRGKTWTLFETLTLEPLCVGASAVLHVAFIFIVSQAEETSILRLPNLFAMSQAVVQGSLRFTKLSFMACSKSFVTSLEGATILFWG